MRCARSNWHRLTPKLCTYRYLSNHSPTQSLQEEGCSLGAESNNQHLVIYLHLKSSPLRATLGSPGLAAGWRPGHLGAGLGHLLRRREGGAHATKLEGGTRAEGGVDADNVERMPASGQRAHRITFAQAHHTLHRPAPPSPSRRPLAGRASSVQAALRAGVRPVRSRRKENALVRTDAAECAVAHSLLRYVALRRHGLVARGVEHGEARRP